MAPSIDDFLGTSEIPVPGTKFVLSDAGAEELNKIPTLIYKKGEEFEVPAPGSAAYNANEKEYETGRIWLRNSRGHTIRFDRTQDLFAEMVQPGKERK